MALHIDLRMTLQMAVTIVPVWSWTFVFKVLTGKILGMLKADFHFHYGRLLWAHKKMFEEPNKDKKKYFLLYILFFFPLFYSAFLPNIFAFSLFVLNFFPWWQNV